MHSPFVSSTFLLLLLIFSPAVLHAKRLAPKPVAPVTHEGLSYSAPHDIGGGKVYVSIHNTKTNLRSARVLIYEIKYNPELERDVQDVYIVSLATDKKKNRLVITDERKRVYFMDLETRKVTTSRPPKQK